MTFDDLFHCFSTVGLLVHPSEMHGMLCGRLTMGESLQPDKLGRISAEYLDLDDVDDFEMDIQNLYDISQQQIQHEGFEFQLLLPDDDTAIGKRTEALASWCNGYLYGLSQAGLDKGVSLSEEALETLGDLSAIAKLQPEDADTEDEMNFFELVEFVRVVVVVLLTELGQSAASEKRTLH